MFKKKQIILLALMFFIIFSLFSPLVSLADEHDSNYTPLAPLPNLTGYEDDGSFGFFVQNSFYLLIGIAGVLAVLMIMIGGIQYMTTDAISGKEEGKERITKALLGLFLAIGAWLILSTINPNILNTDLTIDEIEAPPPLPPSDEIYYVEYFRRFDKDDDNRECLLRKDFLEDGDNVPPKYETRKDCEDSIIPKYGGSYPKYPACVSWVCASRTK